MNDAISLARKQAFGSALATMKLRFNRCYFPGDSCDREAIRAHSVQNARMLELLQEDGHVISPILNMSFQSGPKIGFELIGRNQVTTFHGLCSDHDTAIFSPIENNPLDIGNEEHLFLLSYRAALKEAHATAKAARDTQAGYQAGVDSGLFPAEPCAPGMLAVEHMSLAYMTHLHKISYDAAYQNQNWSSLDHFVMDLAGC